MGAWGPHSFENDAALDWSARYLAQGLPLAVATIDKTITDFLDDKMDVDGACEGIVAVEAVAVALGRGSPHAIGAFAGAPEADPAAAEAVLSECDKLITIVGGEGSELRALWEDGDWDDREAWLDGLRDLRSRLGVEDAAPAPEPVVAAPAPVEVSAETMLEDIRRAISGLEADIQVLRQETEENFARLSRKLEALER